MDYLDMDEGLEADDAREIVVAVLNEHGERRRGKSGASRPPSEEEIENLTADLVMAHRLRSDKSSGHRHRASLQDRARTHQRRVELLTELLESYESELQHKLEPHPPNELPDVSEKEERRRWRLQWLRDEMPGLRERQKRIRWLRETLAEEQSAVDRIGKPPPHPNRPPRKAIIEIALSMASVLAGELDPTREPIDDSTSRIARIIAEMYVRAGIDQRPVAKVEASLFQTLRNAAL